MLKILTDVVRAYIYIDTFRDNTKEGKVHKARLEKEKAANMRKTDPFSVIILFREVVTRQWCQEPLLPKIPMHIILTPPQIFL